MSDLLLIPPEKLFFDANFELIVGDLGGSPPPGESGRNASLVRRVAARLLELPGHASLRELAVGVVRPSERLARAVRLLFAIDDAERRGDFHRVHELFDWFVLDWRWARRSRWVARMLTRHAAEAGLPAPESAAQEVQRAVELELIPLMRARCALRARQQGKAAAFVARIAREALPRGAARLHAAWFAEFVRTLDSEEMSSASVIANVAALVGELDAGDPLRERLVLAWNALVVRVGAEGLNAQQSRTQMARRLELVERALANLPATLGSMQVASALHLAVGVRNVNESNDLAAGAGHVTLALTFDPFNSSAVKALEDLSKLLTNYETQLASARGRLNEKGHAMVAAVNAARAELGAARASVRHERIAAQRKEAIVADLVQRLGLRAGTIETQKILDAFEGALGGVFSRRAAPGLRARAVGKYAGCDALPWELILAAAEHIPDRAPLEVSRIVLVLTMPAPEVPAFELPPPLSPATPRVELPRGSAAALWLGSSRDLLFKFAAVAGIVLGLRATIQEFRIVRECRAGDSRYAAVLDAVRAGGDAAILTCSAAYLAGADADDPRRAQVAEFRDEALLHEVVRRTEAGEVRQVTALLEESGRLARGEQSTETEGF